MDWMTYAWLGWGASFVVLEGFAIWSRRKRGTTKEGRTLSALIWKTFRVFDKNPVVRWTGRSLLLAGGLWLTIHMMFGVFGGPGEIAW